MLTLCNAVGSGPGQRLGEPGDSFLPGSQKPRGREHRPGPPGSHTTALMSPGFSESCEIGRRGFHSGCVFAKCFVGGSTLTRVLI